MAGEALLQLDLLSGGARLAAGSLLQRTLLANNSNTNRMTEKSQFVSLDLDGNKEADLMSGSYGLTGSPEGNSQLRMIMGALFR